MNKSANVKKLEEYGFKNNDGKYSYSTDIMNNEFTLKIDVINKNEIKTQLIEKSFNEPYTLHLVKGAQGTFVEQVRDEYQKILNEIKQKCFEINIFEWEYSYKIIDYAKKKYGLSEEYLWPKFPRNAVCRRRDNQKWFLAILSVNGTKLGYKTNEIIEVVDLRVPVSEIEILLSRANIYPAYHMNKRHWITIILDGSMAIEEIFKFIDISYELAK